MNTIGSKFDVDNVSLDDPKTWDLLQSGYTNGVFQCESKLVQSWLRRIKPKNLWELSALISLVRPGPLASGFADQYLFNKDNPDSIQKMGHPIVDEILSSTNFVCVYQEGLIQLGLRVAWSHLPENERLIKADNLRKAVGKKNQEKILEIGREFVDGCLHNNVDKELSDKLFDLIKKSGRYAFNLSHSMTYAYLAYKTAYIKCHAPLQFLAVYLSYAKFKLDKWEEIFKLISEAKVFGLEVIGPDFNSKNEEFMIVDGKIQYGLSSIKYVSSKSARQISMINDKITNLTDFIKLAFTDSFGCKFRSTTIEALIVTGAFKDIKLSRHSLLNLYKFLSELNDKQILDVLDQMDIHGNISEAIKYTINKTKLHKAREKLETYLAFLDLNAYDDPAWIGNMEKAHLGIQITSSSLDKKDTTTLDKCINCNEEAPLYSKLKVGVIIDELRLTKTKKGANPGQDMAIIKVHDDSAEISSLPIFPDLYEQVCQFLMENNTVLLELNKGKTGWTIQNLEQL